MTLDSIGMSVSMLPFSKGTVLAVRRGDSPLSCDRFLCVGSPNDVSLLLDSTAFRRLPTVRQDWFRCLPKWVVRGSENYAKFNSLTVILPSISYCIFFSFFLPLLYVSFSTLVVMSTPLVIDHSPWARGSQLGKNLGHYIVEEFRIPY